MINIRKLETELWESADLLRAGSKLTSNQYCMPVLGLIFLRYAFSRFKMVEADILRNRPSRGGVTLPVEASDFTAKSALFLPKEAQYEYLVNLPADVAAANLQSCNGHTMNSLGEVVNNAMELVEKQSEQLKGILPKDYTMFSDELLAELLRIFNNSALDEVGGDVIGRIYEYFLNKFAKNIASDDGVFFTPKSLVKMIVNVIEPKSGILLDPACGSGGMFVQTGDFVIANGAAANSAMTFYGQEKVEYNAQLCLMNMAVHGLTAVIKSGDEANTFYHDAHNLDGCCDYVMANPPFNVDKVKAESCENAGRLPFGLPSVNKAKEVGNANYLWISYFYSYLNEHGRAGFVMASSATDSQSKDKDIREKLVKTGHVDVMISVGNNFFYTKSLPCSLWFFDKGKPERLRNTVLFLDVRNYYTAVDRTLNEWTEWQLKNLNAIVWLYRGETEKYQALLDSYTTELKKQLKLIDWQADMMSRMIDSDYYVPLLTYAQGFKSTYDSIGSVWDCMAQESVINGFLSMQTAQVKAFVDSVDDQLQNRPKSEWTGFAQSYSASKWRGYKKSVLELLDHQTAQLNDLLSLLAEAHWLTDKFSEGEYVDVPGLCKVATIDEIKEKGWSLTPGAYVCVAPVADDGVDFAARMKEIHAELLSLQEESNTLMSTISKNMKEMGL